ncbi:hypothetical protein [Paenibacillus sp. YYML68]|uniref:hypothetical protein n=1 Tax=Paenibacillus sp. YYML68 TaxID=2909250 RepID=UPI00249022B4|nr:hypothetical protein [Paenibacillus sp. YYML68]
MEQKQGPMTDTFIEDYEEFLEEDDRWQPPALAAPSSSDRNGWSGSRRGQGSVRL